MDGLTLMEYASLSLPVHHTQSPLAESCDSAVALGNPDIDPDSNSE